ncbi:putative reverse transcriptase domain protein [Mycena venus]|uniref:Putative reverse transcriptase domain protein n=1 Tax=Mycena venus TaxID=2733690 RepID=A0A8H7CRN8_9AGAR|nr:putative reverse transcriptase domain protein [Mycena venus]
MYNHCSYPCNDPNIPSVNLQIDKEDFVCDWGSFTQCYLIIAWAPPGTEASVFDVKSAFRIVPTLPSDRPQLMISWRDKVYFDNVFSFGATSAPGVFGRIADLFVLLLKKGFSIQDILKWVDDFVFFRYPRTPIIGAVQYDYDERLFINFARELGWTWEMDKHTKFSRLFTYLGFDWDLGVKTVTLPEKKKIKYVRKLQTWLAEGRVTLRRKDVDNVAGTLNHCALVVPQGRSRLVSIYKYLASFRNASNDFVKFPIPITALQDVAWWKQELSAPIVTLQIREPPPLNADEIYVDASTSWGIGLVYRGRWLAWRFKAGWRLEGRNIGWGEMVAVELALRTILASSLSNVHLTLRSDNQGVIGALAAGRSYGVQENIILQHILHLFHKHKIWFTIRYIPSKENPADAPSRGILPHRSKMYPYQPRTPTHLKELLNIVLG